MLLLAIIAGPLPGKRQDEEDIFWNRSINYNEVNPSTYWKARHDWLFQFIA